MQGDVDWEWQSCGRRGCNPMGVCPCAGEGKQVRWLAKVSSSLENWGQSEADRAKDDIEEKIDVPDSLRPPDKSDKKVCFDTHVDLLSPGCRKLGSLLAGSISLMTP